jgi:hypothetical protein
MIEYSRIDFTAICEVFKTSGRETGRSRRRRASEKDEVREQILVVYERGENKGKKEEKRQTLGDRKSKGIKDSFAVLSSCNIV